jgi:ribosomal-protein-alanine N-acetyltransferase
MGDSTPMPPGVLETARLRLRPVTAEDVDALHGLFVLPDVRRFLWDDVAIERARAATVVEGSRVSFAQRQVGLRLVHLADAGTMIGFCGLQPWGDGAEVELLYALDPRWWGRGLATEAAVAALADGFASTRLERIYGFTDAPNVASARVMEKAGMTRDEAAGRARGLVAYVARRARDAGRRR